MFREMRRKKQALPESECFAVLDRNTAGVLALSGDGGYPYAVPISYVRDGGRILFHSAKSGHKLDAVARCERASFCVIDQDHVVPEEYTKAPRHRASGPEVRPRGHPRQSGRRYRPGIRSSLYAGAVHRASEREGSH